MSHSRIPWVGSNTQNRTHTDPSGNLRVRRDINILEREIAEGALPRAGPLTLEEFVSTLFDQAVKRASSVEFAELKIDSLNGFLLATNGVVGIGVPTGSALFELNFAYGDVSPALIAAVPLGGMVTQVDVIILNPFNGMGAALSIGDAGDHERLLAVNGNDPATVATYSAYPARTYGVMTDVFLYLTPGAGASSGNGVVLLTVNT